MPRSVADDGGFRPKASLESGLLEEGRRLGLCAGSAGRRSAGDFWTDPRTIFVMIVPSAALGLAWRFVAHGVHSAAVLRAVEIFATWIPSTILLGTQFGLEDKVVHPAGGTTGILHLAVLTGCILVIRAAAVPSQPLTTALVTLVCLGPSVPAAYLRWNAPHGFAGLSIAASGALTFAVVLVFVTIAASVVSRVVHRLEATARKAMQLGQYTLEEKIGEGGMGVVYKARHALLRRPTAIKLLPPDRSSDQAIARFEREVQHTSLLAHPNTVAIYDFGRTPDGIFYYAMEYLDGVTLDALVEMDGPQPSGRVLHILAEVAAALAEAHDAGLVHRDIKPANIMLCDRGGVADTVKVLDFGLVKSTSPEGDVALTADSTITGTPLYMAPEALIDAKLVGAATDLYALGAVGYYLLCGEPVFEGRSLAELCGHHLHTKPTPPSERIDAAIDGELERIVLQCLEKVPAARPASAVALGSMLRACDAARSWSEDMARRWWRERADVVSEHSERARAAPSPKPGPRTVAVALR